MTTRPITPREQIFNDVDSDGDRIQVWSTNREEIALAIIIDHEDGSRNAAYFHVPTLREAFDEAYPAKDVEPAKTLDDVKAEDVADVEEVARYMVARSILDPSGLGVVSVAEVVAMADLIEG